MREKEREGDEKSRNKKIETEENRVKNRGSLRVCLCEARK